jgi:hypothetical protein
MKWIRVARSKPITITHLEPPCGVYVDLCQGKLWQPMADGQLTLLGNTDSLLIASLLNPLLSRSANESSAELNQFCRSGAPHRHRTQDAVRVEAQGQAARRARPAHAWPLAPPRMEHIQSLHRQWRAFLNVRQSQPRMARALVQVQWRALRGISRLA